MAKKKHVPPPTPAVLKAAAREYRRSDHFLVDLALEALQALRKKEGGGREELTLTYSSLSMDKRRIVVGGVGDVGHLAVFGVFGITKNRKIGAPQPFNLHNFKMTWRGSKDHPTEGTTTEDKAAHLAHLEKHR
jgi:hypothetical protein